MNPADIRIGFVPIARPTFDLDLARERTAQVCAMLESAGYAVIGSQALIMDADAIEARIAELAAAELDMLLVLQASFADSTMALQLARAIDAPLLLWALPEAQVGGRLRINSFCGINLAGHGLRRAGIRYDYIYAAPDAPAASEKLRGFRAGRRRQAPARRGAHRPLGREPRRLRYLPGQS